MSGSWWMRVAGRWWHGASRDSLIRGWRVGTSSQGPPLSARKVQLPYMPSVLTTLLPPKLSPSPRTLPHHWRGRRGSHLGPILLGEGGGLRDGGLDLTQEGLAQGIGASRWLRTLVLCLPCRSPEPARSRLVGSSARPLASPCYHPLHRLRQRLQPLSQLRLLCCPAPRVQGVLRDTCQGCMTLQ